MVWRVLVWLLGIGGAAWLAATWDGRSHKVTVSDVDRMFAAVREDRQRRWLAATAAGTAGASCDHAATPAGVSQILVTGDSPAVIVVAPQPLTPRPIEGAEIRCRPALPLRSEEDVALRMMLGQRAYHRSVIVGRPS